MIKQTVFSFPGLGIDWYALDKVVFSVGKIEVRWYGIIITCGIVLAFLYAYLRGKKNEGVVLDDVIDIGLLTVILGIVGARLYYVLTTLDTHQYKDFLDVIAIWEGGLAIYGGIIGGCIGILTVCYLKKIRWQKVFDMIAPGVMIAQALGRWGNFFNGEAYGYLITDTTRFYFFNKEYVLPSGEGSFFHTLRMRLSPNIYSFETPYCFHPTFLYECLWNVLGFILINLFYKKKRFDGQIALMYFVWYGFGRMFIEGFRTDSLYLGKTNIRVSQLLGLAFFLGALALLVIFLITGKHKHQFMTVEKKVPAAPTPEEVAEKEARMEEKARKAEENALLGAEDFLDRMTDFRAEALAKMSRKRSGEQAEAPTPEEVTATEEVATTEKVTVLEESLSDASEQTDTEVMKKAEQTEQQAENDPEAVLDETAAEEETNPKHTEESDHGDSH